MKHYKVQWSTMNGLNLGGQTASTHAIQWPRPRNSSSVSVEQSATKWKKALRTVCGSIEKPQQNATKAFPAPPIRSILEGNERPRCWVWPQWNRPNWSRPFCTGLLCFVVLRCAFGAFRSVFLLVAIHSKEDTYCCLNCFVVIRSVSLFIRYIQPT